MSHEVLMPQLGMAQNSAIIVSWNKSVGDQVSTGEMLLEVETDKAVMEVEARHDGFVTEILVSAGSDVPVGNVIAVISATVDAPVTSSSSAKEIFDHDSEPALASDSESETVSVQTDSRDAGAEQHLSGFLILASPKARRLAFERGVDLQSLADAGLSQPYHAADIPLPSSAETATANSSVSMLQATSTLAAFDELIEWSNAESATDSAAGVQPICQQQLWARTFGDSLSSTINTTIRVTDHTNYPRYWMVKGQGLSTVTEVDNVDHWDLDIIDFSQTCIADHQPAGGLNNTTLIIFANTDSSVPSVNIRLYFSAAVLSTAAAASSLHAIAARCSNPLFQLL